MVLTVYIFNWENAVYYSYYRLCLPNLGALGLLWFLLWMLCASESPNEHKRISEDERQYIVDTLMSETHVKDHQVCCSLSTHTTYLLILLTNH